MATVHGNFLKGVVGNLSFRVVNGKQVISRRRVPGMTAQSLPSKQAQRTFGQSSSLALRIRMFYKSLIDGSADSLMVSRLSSRLVKILHSCCDPETRLYTFGEETFAPLTGLDFNSASPLFSNLKVSPVSDLQEGMLTLSIPSAGTAAHLRFPSGAAGCRMIASLALIRLSNGSCAYSSTSQEIEVDRKFPDVGGTTFAFQVPNDCLCIVVLALKYTSWKSGKESVINNKSFNPMGIVAARLTAGTYTGGDYRSWLNVPNLKFDSPKRGRS